MEVGRKTQTTLTLYYFFLSLSSLFCSLYLTIHFVMVSNICLIFLKWYYNYSFFPHIVRI